MIPEDNRDRLLTNWTGPRLHQWTGPDCTNGLVPADTHEMIEGAT